MKKWIVSSSVFIVSLVITALIGFYVAIFLIGPHSDVLSEWLHLPVGIILLILIVGFPTWLGRKVFYHLGKRAKS